MKIDRTDDTPRSGVLVWVLLALLLSVLILWGLARYFQPQPPPKKMVRLERGIVIHHSATDRVQDGRLVDARWINDVHKRKGFGVVYGSTDYAIGYHFVILQNGTIERGRPEHLPGAHSRGHNEDIGICLVGDFDSSTNPQGKRGPLQPTSRQMLAVIRLCAELQSRHGIPTDRIVGHRDLNDTLCPGNRFPLDAIRSALARDRALTSARDRAVSLWRAGTAGPIH